MKIKKRSGTRAKHSFARSAAFPVVAIGASAGGLEAFSEVLSHLPPTTGMGFVLVQHLDPTHESLLSALIARATLMEVVEATQGARIKPNHVYVIPPNKTMTVKRGHLKLSPRTPELKIRAIDHFMDSLAEDLGSLAIGIILSGNATDGTEGLQAIKAQGGLTFAVDEKSAKFPGMPRSAAASGSVDFVLPPKQIAEELVYFAQHAYSHAAPAPEDNHEKTVRNSIFKLLNKEVKIDFSGYKVTTICRRLQRRMTLHKMTSLRSYLRFLTHNRVEVEALAQDFLIKVTRFFRDPELFDALKTTVFPKLLELHAPSVPVRIWIAGCATGEEAYSFAIALTEFLGESNTHVTFQIFATDVSDEAIAKARAGVYSEQSMLFVSAERQRRFFVRSKSGAQIVKAIRDRCVFARQDVTHDPPFSKIDLISCRNLLIYLDSSLQKKIFPIFHYALKPFGMLILGSSENAGSFTHLFSAIDREQKIFSKKLHTPSRVQRGSFDIPFLEQNAREAAPHPLVFNEDPWKDTDVQKEIDRFFLSRYAPVSILIDENLDIIHFRGPTSAYIEPSTGKASLNLLKMVRPGLLPELRAALHLAIRNHVTVRKENIAFRLEGQKKKVHLEVIPIKTANNARQLLVVFEDAALRPSAQVLRLPKVQREKSGRDLQGILREHAETKHRLQAIIDDQGSTNEEMQAANEEIMSSNEELQSTNEELETTKEELQSTNEELTTVNEELQGRNHELAEVNNDLLNLLSGISIPIVMLDGELRIRRFTPTAQKLLNLIPTDVGRPFTDIKPNLEISRLDDILHDVVHNIATREMECKDREGRWHLIRIRPYKTRENKIDGAVITVIDIDPSKKLEDKYHQAATQRDKIASELKQIRKARE